MFLYVPNLIGYFRILLLFCSLYYMLSNQRLAMLLYSGSYLLDAFDGLAARLLNQSSLFGGMLDMITDRVSTMCLIMTLGHLYPDHFFALQVLLSLDIASHWLHFFSSNLQGKSSHKSSFNSETNFLVRLYYENKLILTSTCAMEQIFYCSLAIAHFEKEALLLWPAFLSAPALLFKNYINLVQIYAACKVMAAAQNKTSAVAK